MPSAKSGRRLLRLPTGGACCRCSTRSSRQIAAAHPSRSSEGSSRGRAESGWLLPILAQGFVDALGARGSDALIDTKCLAQAVQALARVPILQVAVGDAFEGACFLKGDADVAGEDERLIVMVAGLVGGRGPR